MEAAINTLITQFKTYAGDDGSANTLSKDEFRTLVTDELKNLVKNVGDPGVIDQLMGAKNELTFGEFWDVIGKLASKEGGFSQ